MKSGTSDVLFNRQIALEKEMIERGRSRYYALVGRGREKGRESGTSYGKALLRDGLEPFAEAIAEFQRAGDKTGPGRPHKAVKMLEGLDPYVAAFIAMRAVIDTLNRRSMLQNVGLKVGREIELECKLAAFEREDKEAYRISRRRAEGHTRSYRRRVLNYAFGKSVTVSFKPWSSSDCLHLGQKLIELFIKSTGFVRVTTMGYKRVKGGESMVYTLEPSPECERWLCAHQESRSLLYPDFLPTLMPPKPWDCASGGGYYLGGGWNLSLVKTRDTSYLEDLDRRIRTGGLETVITAVNTLQATPWSVNDRVLDVARTLWEQEGGGTAGLPPREDRPLPPCPVCGADISASVAAGERHGCLERLRESAPERFDAWKSAARGVRELNVSLFGRRVGVAKVLMLAEKFSGEERFYFPYQLDFRGRIYAVPPYLNPQGTDLAKGLLRFADGKPIENAEAARWLAIHGSNTFGNDKVSLESRYSWVLANQSRILEVADNPCANQWWRLAESPFCFLAFCFEWAGYVRNGPGFVSRIPVAMDGSCNGLQIFSLILRDSEGGRAVNLVPCETPQDIYQIVADKVVKRLALDAAAPGDEPDVYSEKGMFLYSKKILSRVLIKMNINRKATKRQVMVLPYGGTRESCREYTSEWLKEEINSGRLRLPERHTLLGASCYLAEIIWEAIGETVVAAKNAMAFLQDMASLASRAGRALSWTAPTGFPVVQCYRNMKVNRVKTRLGDKILRMSLVSEGRGISAAKQRSAVAPNYVHSLDAAALMYTVAESRKAGITCFAMIHDSYGTHAADSEELARVLRAVFIRMFGNDRQSRLEEWMREVLNDIPERYRKNIPRLPETGALNVADVARSAFFFA